MTLSFLLAILLRLSGLNASAIWYDEAISRYRASMPLPQLSADLSELQGLNLWELLLRPFAAGPVWMLRIPAFLCSVGALYLAHRIMEHLQFSKIQRTVALIGMAALPGALWMAQDARYYAGLAFVYLLAVTAALERRRWLLLLTCAALVWIHPTGAAWAGSAVLIALLDGFPIRRLWMLALAVPLALPKLISIARSGGEFWLQTVDPAYVWFQTMWAFYADTIGGWWSIPAMFLITMVLVMGAMRLQDRQTRTTYFMTTLPILAMLAVSLVMQPVLFYRTIQPVIPAFCMLAGLTLAPSRKWYTWLAPALAGLVLAVSLAQWDPSSRGGDLQQAAELIRSEWQAGDVIYYATGTAAMPFDYYLGDLHNVLMDQPPDGNLTPPGLPFMQAPLGILDSMRAWVVYPREPLLTDEQSARLDDYVAGGTLVWRVKYLQAADVEIYLIINEEMTYELHSR